MISNFAGIKLAKGTNFIKTIQLQERLHLKLAATVF